MDVRHFCDIHPRQMIASFQLLFMPWAVKKVKGKASQMVYQVVQNHDLKEKSNHVCLGMDMCKFLTFKTLASKNRYLRLFGDYNWQDSHF